MPDRKTEAITSAPKRIDLAQADSIADEFARRHKLPQSDGIVKSLRSRLKMAFGLEAYRNRRKAEKRAMQPALFDGPVGKVLAFPTASAEVLPKGDVC